MTDSARKKSVNPIAAGAAGAVIGVAAGAAAMALSDKNNRKKVEKTMSDMRVWGDKKVKEMKSQVGKTQKEIAGSAKEIKEELVPEEDSSKKSTSSSATTRRTSAQI